jgi:hypothetical protein
MPAPSRRPYLDIAGQPPRNSRRGLLAKLKPSCFDIQAACRRGAIGNGSRPSGLGNRRSACLRGITHRSAADRRSAAGTGFSLPAFRRASCAPPIPERSKPASHRSACSQRLPDGLERSKLLDDSAPSGVQQPFMSLVTVAGALQDSRRDEGPRRSRI